MWLGHLICQKPIVDLATDPSVSRCGPFGQLGGSDTGTRRALGEETPCTKLCEGCYTRFTLAAGQCRGRVLRSGQDFLYLLAPVVFFRYNTQRALLPKLAEQLAFLSRLPGRLPWPWTPLVQIPSDPAPQAFSPISLPPGARHNATSYRRKASLRPRQFPLQRLLAGRGCGYRGDANRTPFFLPPNFWHRVGRNGWGGERGSAIENLRSGPRAASSAERSTQLFAFRLPACLSLRAALVSSEDTDSKRKQLSHRKTQSFAGGKRHWTGPSN